MTDKPKGILVHKNEEEGAIEIDRSTGIILTKTDDRPAWAEFLAVASLAERHGFYQRRLGAGFTEEHKSPEALKYEDLSWIGVNEDGDEITFEADSEFRQDVVAKVLGIDREDFEQVAGTAKGYKITEVEIDLDARTATKAEASEIDTELASGFAGEGSSEGSKKANG